jgi:NADH-quinone oxidoreductase subunit M
MIFLGTFRVWPIFTMLAVIGVLIAAGYILWTFQRTLFGPGIPRWQGLSDASPVEMVAPVVLTVAIMGIGLYPSILVDVFGIGIHEILEGITR